jgi:hypothetical protein
MSQRIRLVFMFAILFATTAIAQENCGYTSSLHRSGFEAGEQPTQVILPLDSTPVAVTILSPTNGDILGVPSVQVIGSYTGPVNTGISVNDIPVINNADKFVSTRVALTPGSNVITLKYATLDGAPQAITRTVTYTPSAAPNVLLTAASAGDYAPLRMPFTLSTTFPPLQTTINRVQLDFDGDGTFDSDTTAIGKLEFAYSDAGYFLAKARVTFDDGNSGTPPVVVDSTTAVLIQSLPYTRQTLCNVHYTMKHRLQQNQPTSALNTLSSALRPRFQTLWDALQTANTLVTTANKIGEIVDGQISRNTAELLIAIATTTAGEFNGYPMRFRRGNDGVWRIDGM